MTVYPRLSGRLGQPIDLGIAFYRNGVPQDPYAIRLVEIYHTAVLPHNLLMSFPVVDPTDSLYPAPVQFGVHGGVGGACGTAPSSSIRTPGAFDLIFSPLANWNVPDVFFDLWYYFSDNPCGELGSGGSVGCDLDAPQYKPFLNKQCHRFWLYADVDYSDDALQSINFAFEPLNRKFNSPEVKPLEVGIMPTPLYDYNFNLVNPMIPLLTASITIQTQFRELLVDRAPMVMGVRQGSYRSNPYVLRYNLDTTKFLRGTYQYNINLNMPDGTVRTSPAFFFSIQ